MKEKAKSKINKRLKVFGLISFLILFLLVVGFIGYTSIYYSSVKTMKEYKDIYATLTFDNNKDYIKISQSDSDSNVGIIFYQGGKVEYTAYIPLLAEYASKGYNCYLAKMPFRLAVFGINAADNIMEDNKEIKKWYIGGHSLGGAMASSYAARNHEKLSGLILLGAYPSSDLSETGLDMIVLYGQNDLVLNREALEETRTNQTKNSFYYEIQGANHAGFGDYGEQKGDGIATISSKELMEITIKLSEEYLLSNK